MFTEKTTLILGAGASCGYGYPLGHGLIDEMIRLAGKWAILRPGTTVSTYGARIKELLTFYDPVSIDSFLYHYEHDPVLVHWAKTCIGETLLSCANFSKFARGEPDSANWYRLLWNAIVSGATIDELTNPGNPLNLSIITFNYDASLEIFLHSRVTQKDSIFATNEQKDAFLAKLNDAIHHVYGCVMHYKWRGGPDDNDLYVISEKGYREAHAKMSASRIMLINEREEANYDTIRKLVFEARQVIFLGFGFDDINIGEKVLNLRMTLRPRKDASPSWNPLIKYTNFGDSEIINRKLMSAVGSHLDRPSSLQKSTKKVYEALSEDFSLTSRH